MVNRILGKSPDFQRAQKKTSTGTRQNRIIIIYSNNLLLGNFHHITVVFRKVLTYIKSTKLDYMQENERYLELKIYIYKLN